MKNFLLSLSLFLLSISNVFAQVKLSPLFSDNMVFQQKTDNAPIWGESKPGKTITITTSWDGNKTIAKADEQGQWKTTVKTPEAGGPYTITISDGKKKTVLNNILIGEVWLCSGQSNMEMPVEGWGHVKNWEQEKIEANNYPNIRFLYVEHTTSSKPTKTLNVPAGGWQVCNSESVAGFSACAYFFGRDIQKYRNVPIGLIDTSWGGTFVEPWTSREALAKMPDQKENLARVDEMPADKAERDLWYKERYNTWVKQINTLDAGYNNGIPTWAQTSADDSSWNTVVAPKMFDEQRDDIKSFDGFFWIRKTIDIPASWVGKELEVSLGAIDDNDITFFNGEEIGSTIGCTLLRTYTIPSRLVKAGKATIAIRIQDTGGLAGIGNITEKDFAIGIKGSKDKTSLAGDWKYALSVKAENAPGMPVDISNNPNEHTVLYNAMIYPIIPFTIKGAIWYQGEANTNQAYQYRELMPLMIKDWRNQWGYDFPFYQVQLANYMARHDEPTESAWAELREAQLLTRQHLENVGMATIIDIGEAGDIHPKNKQEVGHRLALAARANAYGEKITYEGPTYRSYKIDGNTIRVFFNRTQNREGLKTSNGGAVKGFSIAGLDHKWHWADARIEDNNTVVVSSPDVDFPIAVRYAWADNPECNLTNTTGLPASPFRTDDWQGITFGNKR